MQVIENDNSGEGVVDIDDDNFTVDMGNTQETKREVIPRGDYNVVISSCDYQRSAASNQPMWSIQLEIQDGEYAGRKIYTNLSFSPKAMSMTKGALKSMGHKLADEAFNPKAVADSGDLLGFQCKVRTKLEQYQGEPQTRVQRWFPGADAQNAFVNP